MSFFRSLCLSRSVALHLVLWLLTISLVVLCCATTPESLFRSFSWLFLDGAADRKRREGTSTHSSVTGTGGGSSSNACKVVENFFGGVFVVSKCQSSGSSSSSNQESQQQQVPAPSFYEIHMRVPTSFWQAFDLFMTPKQFVAIFDSWSLVLGSVAVVFVAFLSIANE